MQGVMSTSSGLSYHNVGDFYPRKFGPKPDVVPSGVTERKVGPLDKPDMVSVDVINDSDLHLHRKKHEQDVFILGTIHPFRKTHRSIFGKLSQELRLVSSDRRSWRILLFGALNLLCTGCLLMWCSSTNSMAGDQLKTSAFCVPTTDDLSAVLHPSSPVWPPSQGVGDVSLSNQDAVTASQVAGLGLADGVERFLEQPEVHTGRLLVGTFVALVFNLLTLLSVRNKPFCYVSEAASSSWLQEHVADLSRSVCGIVPGLSSVLLPRMNPFVLINAAGALSLCVTYVLIEINNYDVVDTVSAVAIALMTFGTMYPMSVYSGKVLLQTTPSHVIGQLDKLLREVSTLDGVLEVRNEHFWTVGFGTLAGSAHVRIRRDANEQLVLAHVTNRLLPLVPALTVQIFKDDWTGPFLTGVLSPASSVSAPPPPAEVYAGLSSLPPPPPPSDPLTSTPSKPSSPPPEFAFNTPGRNVQAVVLPAPGSHAHRAYGGMLGQGAGHGDAAGGGGDPYRTVAYSGSTVPLRFGTRNPLAPPFRP
ncbi:zinc transporter 6 [Brachionichthys hirsutus]|uniref:zinc transporter 6 n=1 Tax=Brachionichthys hirsutus TaxID=412623 RepID=UPI00360538E5